jgi:O-antigen ligase
VLGTVAVVDGTGRETTGSGAVIGLVPTVSATGTRILTGSGAVLGSAAVLAATGTRTVTGSGAINSAGVPVVIGEDSVLAAIRGTIDVMRARDQSRGARTKVDGITTGRLVTD